MTQKHSLVSTRRCTVAASASVSNSMDANELRALQAPLKKRYREQAGTALTLARAEAMLDVDRLACGVRS